MSDLPFIDRSGLTFLSAAGIALATALTSISAFFHCDYIQYRSHQDWTTSAGYTKAQFIALFIGTYALPFGLVFLLIYSVQSAKSRWGYEAKIAVYFLLMLLSIAGVVVGYYMSRDVLDCGIFCYGNGGTQRTKNDAAIIFVGLLYFMFSFAFMIFFFLLTLHAYFGKFDAEPSFTPSRIDQYETKPLLSGKGISQNNRQTKAVVLPKKSRVQNVLIIAVVFSGLFPLMLYSCMTLPTWWSYFSKYSIQEYEADKPSQDYGTYWSITIGPNLVLKLFPDILIYYMTIYAVSIVAITAEAVPALRTRLHRKPWFLAGYCVGETLLFITIVTLIVGQFLYWFYDHGWEESVTTSRSKAERAARAVGQVSNMVTGFLTLPVARNSVWHILFSVPWESMIKYHQYLGYTLICLVICHAGLWWKVYAEQGTFPHDIFAVPQKYHQDNFTVPLAVLTTILMIIAFGIFGHYTVRRANYDLFYWVHHFSMILFLVMLWHSTMSWYYITAGLALWAVDHVIRLYNCIGTTAYLQNISIKGNGNIVNLSYTVARPQNPMKGNPFMKSAYGPLPHTMGQYVFINIPLISQLAWHPFSISSAPGESHTQHHIKVMGLDQWTGRLLYLARSMSSGSKGQIGRISINIDGPYGIPLQASRYRNILLVAGGIGITPLHSCFKHMFLCHTGIPNFMKINNNIIIVIIIRC